MQVMTKIHDDKYEAFGGNHAAFDPVTNLRVGVQVLKECIARAGSLEAGLRYYVGAANLEPTTAVMPARCWPSRTTCAWWPAARRCRPTVALISRVGAGHGGLAPRSDAAPQPAVAPARDGRTTRSRSPSLR